MNYREAAIQETEKLKQEVNLVEFAARYAGYAIDSDKTSDRQVEKGKHVLMKNQAGDKIIISKGANGHWIYFNPENSLDKGTIFDFLQKRLADFNMKRAKETIYSLTNANQDLLRPVANFKPYSEKDFTALLQEFGKNLKPVVSSEFLKRRGISQDERFKNLVRDRLFLENFQHKGGGSFENTVFPLYTVVNGKFSVCGFDRRNDNFKGFVEESNRQSGIWETKPPKDAPVGAYVVSESPLDALSYAELNPPLFDSNPVLAACDGNITDAQIRLFSQRLDFFKPVKILMCNDDDNAGEFFSAKILAGLRPGSFAEPDYLERYPMLAGAKVSAMRAGAQGIVVWQFSHDLIKDTKGVDAQEQLILSFKAVEDYYSMKNRELLEVNSDKEVFQLEKKFDPLNSEITVSFPNNKYNWREINESLLNLRYNFSERIEIKRPLHKDFNDDLMISKGLRRADDPKKDRSQKL